MAVDGRNTNESNRAKANTIACKLSHIKALENAKKMKWQSVLILEDDIFIPIDFDKRFDVLLNNAPDKWDMLFFHGTFGRRGYKAYNKHWYRVFELYGAFAYMVHSSFYETAINKLKEVIEYKGTDDIYSLLMPSANFFRAIEPCIFHLPGFSVREEKNTTAYKHLMYR